ncbi:hypothetical protein MRX96_055766 [Rhipicephalus microplus]
MRCQERCRKICSNRLAVRYVGSFLLVELGAHFPSKSVSAHTAEQEIPTVTARANALCSCVVSRRNLLVGDCPSGSLFIAEPGVIYACEVVGATVDPSGRISSPMFTVGSDEDSG